MASNSQRLLSEILMAVRLDAFLYDSYSAGRYGQHKAPGVTLQFQSLLHRQPAYTVFNASLDRVRGPNKGKALPKGQFRVSSRSHFVRFWRESGLAFPNRLSKFHDYMGNLRGILFAGKPSNERLDAGTLRPLSVRSDWIIRSIDPDSIRTNAGQYPDSTRTILPDNDFAQCQSVQGVDPISSAGHLNYGKKVARDTGTRGSPSPAKNPMVNKDQSVEEWLADYGEVETKIEFNR
jgi:hypothetical protein